jgi:hypothetical protein
MLYIIQYVLCGIIWLMSCQRAYCRRSRSVIDASIARSLTILPWPAKRGGRHFALASAFPELVTEAS